MTSWGWLWFWIVLVISWGLLTAYVYVRTVRRPRLKTEREAERLRAERESSVDAWEKHKADDKAACECMAETARAFIKEHGDALQRDTRGRYKPELVNKMRQNLRARNLSERNVDDWLEQLNAGRLFPIWDAYGWTTWARTRGTWSNVQWAAAWGAEIPASLRIPSHDYDDHDDHDGPNYWATGTYDPDRYWAAVHEYGHSHMDYIHDAYGDLDTYEANRPG